MMITDAMTTPMTTIKKEEGGDGRGVMTVMTSLNAKLPHKNQHHILHTKDQLHLI